jgi:TRAP transporter TAXI family solute receptor
MKKNWWIVGVLVIAGLFPLFAQNRQITFNTGAVGGLYMEPGVIWADQWEKAIPGLKVSCVLGGSMANVLVVPRAADPNSQVGIADSISAFTSIKGTGEFATRAPQGIKNLRALWRFNVISYAHVLARPEVVPAGVTSLKDLLAKNPKIRIALKVRGSGDEILFRQMCQYLGYTYADLEKKGARISFNNPADISSLLIDGHADLTVGIVRIPASYVLDMDASIPNLKWLDIGKDVVDKLAKEGYIAGNHPTGAYSSLKQNNYYTVGQDHIVFVQEKMDTDLVYRMVKAVLADPDRVKSIAALKTFDAKAACTDTIYPLHPGAEKAFREAGYLK